MKSTRWIYMCGLLAMVLLVGACSNRQSDDRLIAAEVATNTLHTDVQDLDQRMQALEGRLNALGTEVGSLEIKTLKGAKTSYMVVPAVKATPYIPLTAANAAPQAAPAPAAPAATAQAPVAAPSAQTAPTSHMPVASGVALSLPPTSAPMPAQSAPTSAPRPEQATFASAQKPTKATPTTTARPASTAATAPTAPATPIPVQSAVSLALPPENSTAVFGQPAQQETQQAHQQAPQLAVPVAPTVAQSSPKAGTAVSLAPLAPKIKGEESAYNAALALARGGKTAEAINSFTAFLQQYPAGRYAPNAYYWMGECLYAQRNYTDALLQFKDVAARYPRHHKTADALLKAGMTYDRLGDKENAALQYKALVTDFPSSDAARRVKGRGAGR